MQKTSKGRLRAIDLYSGVGGWGLGLKLAGIDVVRSYEHWEAANHTNRVNSGHRTETVDIRALKPRDIPKNIDIVVGSPPCTQFSYSNRGGNGNVKDGLVDIKKFLAIVKHLQPKFWLMENVPRVAQLLERELKKGGALAQFSQLGCSVHVLNLDAFGLPQKRKRCIVGNLDFDLLNSYTRDITPLTLGHVVSALSSSPIVDPIYGLRLTEESLHDHVREDFLDEEETRINRASKIYHPIYNAMAFPDRMDRPVRTITATCTRVSRESVIIEDLGQNGNFRRLTVRERACLQGFPASFQFYASSYSHKLRMVGNAVPPVFSFYVGQAILGVSPAKVMRPDEVESQIPTYLPEPTNTRPGKSGTRFSPTRTFRFSVPSLMLKSGVRFELRNTFQASTVSWEIAFHFGSSKSIHSISLVRAVSLSFASKIPQPERQRLLELLNGLRAYIRTSDIGHLQQVWSHRGPGGIRPFMLLDRINEDSQALLSILQHHPRQACAAVKRIIRTEYRNVSVQLKGLDKLERNAPKVLAGFLIASTVNRELRSPAVRPADIRAGALEMRAART